jgi:two-component system, chemotaxis family, chemotaxis protein CheY
MGAKTILCVDDSPTIRKLVKKALEPEGYQVLEAENGQAALDMCDSQNIDFFLVDVNMPVLDGFGFVEKLNAEKTACSQTPVVFLTTESGTDKKQRGKELGVRGWVVKPFEASSLIKLVSMLTG